MSHPMWAPLRQRIGVEFVEADVEIGFSLVDLARSERSTGGHPIASRALQDAEAVVTDIARRLERAGDRERESFGPLLEELRREIDSAKSQGS